MKNNTIKSDREESIQVNSIQKHTKAYESILKHTKAKEIEQWKCR